MEQSSVNMWASQAGLEPETVEVDSVGTSRVYLGLTLSNGLFTQGLVKVESAKRGGSVLASAGLYRSCAPYKVAADGYREYDSVEAAIEDMAIRFAKLIADEDGKAAEEEGNAKASQLGCLALESEQALA